LASKTPFYDRQVLLFNLWSNTFCSLNSTFNCVIFFWRNSILRREGMFRALAYVQNRLKTALFDWLHLHGHV
jgi:hypothetical protein